MLTYSNTVNANICQDMPVLDKVEFQCADVVFASLKNCVSLYVCCGVNGVQSRGGSKVRARGGKGPALCKMRQLTCSMGQGPLPQVKIFALRTHPLTTTVFTVLYSEVIIFRK
jgi:hypothetical protein